ncbi:hypothetical protein MTR62_04490 [Novosphingobium sp. 1949]|uniref:DUF3024 domain-containing protein n=1 Tax=Novosphingobium organovorum TaxID=2930092 RepID=A0ABT0BAB1_9SPHN|nr:hypothetical protein [Novosphingobium organovorum]MCJ2181963.1 hypothetical protein [Novosphingobium organovorum]
MSIAAALRLSTAPRAVRQPNEFDRMRVARTLEQRTRYRYVAPSVEPVVDGYLVRSPCCSRRIDPAGGEIDVALLLWDEERRDWLLYRRDHGAACWIEDGRFARLGELLVRLNTDPARVFWQ